MEWLASGPSSPVLWCQEDEVSYGEEMIQLEQVAIRTVMTRLATAVAMTRTPAESSMATAAAGASEERQQQLLRPTHTRDNLSLVCVHSSTGFSGPPLLLLRFPPF